MSNEHKVFNTISIYDAFLEVVGNKQLTQTELQQNLWLTDDSNAGDCLQQLVEMRLLVKRDEYYSPSGTGDCQRLTHLLFLAVSFNLDYNFYISEEMRALVQTTYGRRVFSIKQLAEVGNVRDIYRLVRRLCMDSLVAIFTYTPLTGKLLPNSFTDALCAYWRILPRKSGIFERRVKSDVVINDLLEAQRKNDRFNIIEGAKVFFSSQEGEEVLRNPGEKLQNLMRFDIMPKNPEVFDRQQTEKTKKAIAYIKKMVDSQRPLNRQIIGVYHSLSLFGNEDAVPYRDYEVSVANNPDFKPTPAANIERAMLNMLENYKHDVVRAKNISKVLDLAAYIYCELIHIQPYEDGNSRTSMMAMLHVLNLFTASGSVLPSKYEFVIPNSYDIIFIQTTKGAAQRNDDRIAHLLQDIYLNIINKSELKEMVGYR